MRFIFGLVVAIVANAALAQGKTYLGTVGELAGKTITPNVVSEFCSERDPSRAAEYQNLYASWRNRHAELFAAIDEQLDHANALLLRQSAPGGDHPIRAAIDALGAAIRKQFLSFTPDQAESLCDGYFPLLETKDAEFVTEVTALLTEARRMDTALSH